LYRSVCFHMRADAVFVRETENGIFRVPAYFAITPQLVNNSTDAAIADLNRQADRWNSRGSGFVIEHLIKFVICITQYRPLHGSTYVKTPANIANKKCVVNVKNDYEKCFAWAVLSGLYPPNNHDKNEMYNYAKYMGVLNLHGLSFPMKSRDIPRFEKQNSFISVNVLYHDVKNREFFVEYLSPHKDREKHVNLLLLQGEGNKFHYVNITSMSRLVSDRTKH